MINRTNVTFEKNYCRDLKRGDRVMDMTFELNKVYNGFTLISEKEIKEINSIGRLFKHEKSGARLLSLFNDDDNKTFAISFRTPPEDSTGLTHILEHSVLSGSRKFPVKEPLLQLLKGSLKTFINASTYSDKTLYPASSRNFKDYMNIMDVYFDAVFYPNIYKRKETFMQEGWHYHLENPEDTLTYKGVVYNEMKGAFSSPESVLERKIDGTVLKDTPYANISGGNPEFIPDLNEEQFLNFHKKYYHPSNSYIMIYGDGDINEQLKFINDEYLSNFDAIEVDSQIKEQEPYNELLEVIEEYPISKGDSEEDKTFLSLNYVTGKVLNREDVLGMNILSYMLLKTSGAPLKKALIDSKLGKDVLGDYYDDMLQPIFSIVVKNSNEDKKEDFKKVVYDTLRKLVDEGIEKELIEASLNIKEFELREGNTGFYPKGVIYAQKAMETWLYDGSPFEALEYEEDLENIKEASRHNYFENLIEKYILNNTHGSLFILKPKSGLGDEKAEKLQKKLDAYKESLTKEEIDKLVESTNNLIKVQKTPDSPEDLETIPMLDLKDINKDPERLSQEELEVSGSKVLFHDVFTSGIMYMNILFDGEIMERESIPYVSLLTHLLGEISTENSEYMKLSNDININTGGIKYAIDPYKSIKLQGEMEPKFIIKTKVLWNNFNKLVELLNEIVHNTKFDDYKRIKDILLQVKSRKERSLVPMGSLVAADRVMSYFSRGNKYKEETSGVEFYKFVCNLIDNYDELKESIVENLKNAYRKIFNRNNMIISITCEKNQYEIFQEGIVDFIDKLCSEAHEKQPYIFEENQMNEGLTTSGNVQYVAKGYNYNKLGIEYSGKLQVLSNIASLDYLWNKIRVQGGAYGCSSIVDNADGIVFVSYRDPNLKETLKVYDETAEFLSSLNISEREMRKYIIGTISTLDRPLSPELKGEIATYNYIRKLSYDDLKKEREEVLSTNQEDIKNLSSIFEKIMEKNYICVLGNENKINENKDLFNEIVKVL